MSEHTEAIRGVDWPSNGLSEVPFRVYTDPEQYRLEQERIFKGPSLELSVPCGRDPEPRRLGRHHGRRDRGHRRPRRGRRDQRLCQSLRPSRQSAVPRAARAAARRSPASITAGPMTSPASSPASRSSTASSARAACRPSSARTSTICQRLRVAELAGLVFGTFSDDGAGSARPISARDRRRAQARAEPAGAHPRPQHADIAEQLEALFRERQGHLPRLDPALVSDDVPHQPADDAGRHLHRRQRRQSFQPGQARLRRRGRRLQARRRCAPTASSSLQDHSVVESVDEYGDRYRCRS